MSFPVRGLSRPGDLSTTEPWEMGQRTSKSPPSSTTWHLFLHQTYWLRPPRLPGLQGHEHGVVRQGHEEVVRVHLCAVLFADQGHGHRGQGEQQSVANLRHILLRIPVRMRALCGGTTQAQSRQSTRTEHLRQAGLFCGVYNRSYLLSQLLQRPSRDALSGLSAVTTHSERTLRWRPHAFGNRSVKQKQPTNLKLHRDCITYI